MVSIGPTIRIEGESNYRQALRRIYSETRTLEKEMESLKNSFSKYDSELSKNKRTSELLTKQMEAQKNTVNAAKTTYEIATKKFNDTTKAYEEQREKVEPLKKKLEELTNTIDYLEKKDGVRKDYLDELKQKQAELTKEYDKEQKSLDKLNNEVMRSSTVMEDHKGKVAEAEAEYNKLQTQFKELPNSLSIVGGNIQEFGEKMASVGSALTKYVTVPLVGLATTSIKQASDFEDGMHKIYTIAEEGTKPMAEMREELIALSRDTGYSLDDLTEAAYQAVSASVDVADATEFLATATNLARAGFTTTTQSVDLLTTVMNAYGKGTYDAAYISDVLLRTQNDGKTIIDELAGSMGTVIPTAANYNISLEQIAAAYATMTKQGVNTARATTFMNAMFTELEKEGSDVADILEAETGKSFAQLMGEGRSLADVLKILYENVGEDNEQFQRLFGNVRSGKAAAALTADDFAILNYEIERMGDTTGQTAYALEMLETPSLQAKRALNNFKLTAVDIGEVLMEDWMPAFEWAVGIVKDIAVAFHNLDPELKKAITRSATVVASLGPVIWTGGKVIQGVGTLTKNLGEAIKQIQIGEGPVNSFITALGKWGPVVGTVTAVAVGMGYVATKTYESMQEDWKKIESQYALTEEMKETIKAINWIDESYENVARTVQGNIQDTQAQVEIVEMLVDEYNNLVDETGLATEESQAMADVIIEQLCEALGMDEESVRNLIDANGKFSDSMEEVIAQMEREAAMAAAKRLLQEVMANQIEANRQLETVSRQVQEAESKVTQTEQALAQAQQELEKHTGSSAAEMQIYQQKVDNARLANISAKDTLKELKTEEEKAQRQVKQLADDHEYYMNFMAYVAGNANASIEGYFEETATSAKDSLDEIARKSQDVYRTVSAQWANQVFSASFNVGTQITNGLSTGIKVTTKAVNKAAISTSNKMLNIMNQTMGINSPSKKTMEMGKYLGEGLVIGMNDMMNSIDKASREMAMIALGENYYIPEPSTMGGDRNISAPISVAVTVTGNVDDHHGLAEEVAEVMIAKLRGESEVFA